VVILDTHALVFDALAPERLSRKAARTVERAAADGDLACSDISLWETAMLMAKGRLEVSEEVSLFLYNVIQARAIDVLAITPEIAALATSVRFPHGDPADRIIASTAMVHRAVLVSADEKLKAVQGLSVVW
jgi:PIN domain nuclease of toxin-antitoxin system